MRAGVARLPLVLGALILSGCDLFRESAPEPASFVVPIANHRAELELALTIAERQEGLQKRLSLGENEGMAFLYEEPQRASFWMKNTEIPLDIGFFTGDGVLREIHRMLPNVEIATRSHRDDIVIAVEMNEHWFRKRGIKPGDSIDLSALQRAIRARGEDPADYPLQTARGLRP
ncbi:MAG: DUF192 domain-containing protein [Puniceicoccaceae bacterium]